MTKIEPIKLRDQNSKISHAQNLLNEKCNLPYKQFKLVLTALLPCQVKLKLMMCQTQGHANYGFLGSKI